MLTNSYIHIPYVGYITEKKIWDSGITSWDSFNYDRLNLREFRKRHIKKYVDLSIESFEKKDHGFFSSLLSPNEHWRCLPDVHKVAYLDIETTGLDKENDDITLIGVYDGHEAKTFVKGRQFLEFKEYIKSFPMIVTFNGSCFDLPFIASNLGIQFDQLHLDLRIAFKKLGVTGGLKRIEAFFGLKRSRETKDLDGLGAVRLWYKYVDGDDGALELLKKYNKEDIIGLKILAQQAYSMLRKNLFEYNQY